MKILRSLSKKYLSIIIIFFLIISNSHAEDKPVDIWNIDKEKIKKNSENKESSFLNDDQDQIIETNVFNMQSQKNNNEIKVDISLNSKEIKIIGLYDPEDYGLKIDMWSTSNGDRLKYLFSNIDKLDLSKDAAELMNISLLTNAYYPNQNISEEEFLKIKSSWLSKNKDLDLIEKYLIKNQILNLHPNLSKFLVDEHLSESNLEKACEIFLNNSKPIKNDYLSKFNIYCLINIGKLEEAQLIYDLKKELGFEDKYFEKKLNYLFGYNNEIDLSISENSILDFHLAHRTNPEFIFEPNESTNKLIWKYLAASNLLYKVEEIDINELDKIALIEKATHEKNYPEKDLLELYKRFQFNINQLLNAKDAHKILSDIESRALIYQRLLLESDDGKKLQLVKILKDSFIKDKLKNAFESELKKILDEIDIEKIPSDLTTFYTKNIENDQEIEKSIKFNNDILHQSKLINYFNGDYTQSKIEKDLNNFLKKIKKNKKKYLITKKDIILIESLRSDGIKISKKYDELYEISESEMPTDIQVMINNNEVGAVVLRIIEVIGQDRIEMLDDDTIYFIISALNQLNIDFIRNKILLKVLPLKV